MCSPRLNTWNVFMENTKYWICQFTQKRAWEISGRAALKVIPPTLLCCLMMSEVDVRSMAVEVIPDCIPLHFVAVADVTKGQFGKRASVIEVCMKGVELNPSTGKKKHPSLIFTDPCWMFMEPMGVCKERWLMACFSSVKENPCSEQLCGFLFLCRLLFISSKNAHLMVMAMLKNHVL